MVGAENFTGNVTSDHALQQYAHAKQAVTTVLRKARTLLDCGGHLPARERLDALLTRLAEDRFHLVVLGQFKRGKSSLINAIIGRDLLPTASVPLTSVVTALRYGPAERATIRRRGWVLPQEIPVSQLADYITERGNPSNEKGVISAEVEAPAPFLRRHVFLYDTPGIGSVYAHNTATTYAFLPEVDAAIFVTSVDGPLTDAELAFLDNIRQHIRKVFFVLNKVDQLNEREREEVLTFTREMLARHTGVEGLKIFPISARQALHAKAIHDLGLLEASGLPALEAALAGFLRFECGEVFLTALLDRALRIVEEERSVLTLAAHTHQQSMAERATRLASLHQQMNICEVEIRSVMEHLTRQVDGAYEALVCPLVDGFVSEATQILTVELSQQEPQGEQVDAEEYYGQLLTWGHRRLGELAQAWLAQYAGSFQHIAEEFTQAALPLLAEIIERVMQVVQQAGDAGAFEEHRSRRVRMNDRVAGLASANAEHQKSTGTQVAEELLGHWHVPPFDVGGAASALQARYAMNDEVTPFVPLPQALARRVMRRAARHRLAALVPEVGAALRDHVRHYLRWCVSDLCRVAQQVADARRQHLEQALQGLMDYSPSTPDSGPLYQTTANDGLAQRREELAQLMKEIAILRDALVRHGHVPDEARIEEQPIDESDSHTNAAPGRISSVASSVTDLQDRAIAAALDRAEKTSSCPLCAAVLDAVTRFLSQLQYALATDSATQRELRSAHGLCAHHTWQLEALSSPHGLCSGYPPLLEQAAQLLLEVAELPPSHASQRIQELLPDAETCAACRVRQETEQTAAARLAARLGKPEGWATVEGSNGLCIPHLRLILTLLDSHLAAQILRHQAGALIHIVEAMHGYVLKCDARRRELLTPDEDEAYRRALVLLVGERHVY